MMGCENLQAHDRLFYLVYHRHRQTAANSTADSVISLDCLQAVSYTHLDVYKRQIRFYAIQIYHYLSIYIIFQLRIFPF